MFKKILLLLILAPIVTMAQNFRKGALYEISSIPLEYEHQLLQLSELSGSWRIIDPFKHRALRMADNGLAWGEENGSDELQKWIVKPAGNNKYTLTPANSQKRLAKNVVVIKESQSFGSDENCTYRFVCANDKKLVLGNGKNGGNNARIKPEAKDSLDRGQYWTIKTLAPNKHVVCNAFSTQYFDDGGDNAHIDYLLQWPANPGNYGNALMAIKPVKDKPGVCQILSFNKNKMFTARNGQMTIADIDETDPNSWFVIEEVAKPKIKSPVWEDETVFEQNKLPAVAAYTAYVNEKEMLSDSAHYAKPWLDPHTVSRQSLDGMWNFYFVSSPDKKPDGHELSKKSGDTFKDWDNITVPGCWEMQGYDRPIYCNVEYPHSNTPPYINARDGYNNNGENYGINPVGTYRRTFSVDKNWLSKRTIIHFGGIYSAALVYLNGQYVGYTQGSNNVAEFDITRSLKEGENNLVVQVFRWCDGSYLECQDMFRMSGIFRQVYMYNVPVASVRDHYITSHFNADYTKADVNVKLTTEGAGEIGNVTLKLFDPNGKLVAQSQAAKKDSVSYEANFAVANPQLWSAEIPTLYTLHVIQSDGNGNEQMAFSTKYGFREVYIKNSLLYLNGKRLFLKGVNRHDSDPYTGRTVSAESMERDVLLMKQNNINTIRTSHYPNDVRMFSMFDYYGLYVCAEADLEDHANQSISDMPSWIPSFVDRIDRLVGIYRNYPSVVMWSLGNESGAGRNFKYCYDKAHSMDSLRPIHYEGTRLDKDYGGSAYSDFYSKMYPSMNWMYNNTSNLDKPMFVCEYAHSMGNAIGNLTEYWESMETSNSTIGGCIWDWVDQSIYEPHEMKNGIYRIHTGYDFPGPHQGNFCCNGVIRSDRGYSAKLAEVNGVFQSLDFKRVDQPAAGNQDVSIRMKNKFSFVSTDNVDITYEYLADGKAVASGSVPLKAVLPGDSMSFSVPALDSKAATGEILLNIYAAYATDTKFCKKGHVLAKKQFVIKERAELADVQSSGKKLTVDNTGSSCKVFNDNISVEFDKATGQLKAMSLHGKNIIADGMGFVFANHRWIENDRFGNVSNGLKPEGEVRVEQASKKLCVVSTSRQGEIADQKMDYRIYSNGVVDMTVEILPHSAELRRAGVACAIDSAYSNVEYYALGPWENYCDRQSGVTLGRFYAKVDELSEDYVKPQTTGDRCKMRELILRDNAGHAVKIESEGDVSFSANRHTDEDLMNAKHQWELVDRPFVYLHFDGAQRGLGNASCGPGPMQKYTIPQEPVKFKLRISDAQAAK